MATIFIFNLIITIDKNLYVIYNILYNQGVFIMENENNKVYIKPFIILFLISIVIFAIMYFLHSKNIENRFNRTLQNYEKSMSAIFNNMIITNRNNENIYTNSFQTNNEIRFNNKIENLKLSFEVGFKMLESSMNEIMKNSNDILQFWFAFLSVIMIVFTIIGFFLNNNILENAKKQLEMVEKEARTSRENIEKETKKLIEENNKKRERENKNLVVANSSILKKQEEKKLEEIESMYRDLVIAIKNSNDEKALEILENIFSIDEKNYLALNGAGILYTRMYSKNNKSLYFRKADKYYESAISIYDNKDILNNKAVLYSTRYGIDKSDYDYNTALTIFDNMIYSSNNSDFILLNNRATIYLAKYNITGNNELFENALKDYEEIIKLDNRNVYALNNRSSLYFNKYKKTNDNEYFEKSIQDCSSAFKIDANEALKNDEGPIYIYKY